ALNWLDLTLGAMILISAVAAARKGLSREVIGLAASLLGLLLAVWFYRSAGARLAPYISSEWAASLGGFILIFFGVLILGGILSAVVGRLLKTIGLSMVDRLLGAAFGLVRGLLFGFGFVTLLLAFFPGEKAGKPPSAVIQSRLAPHLMKLSRMVAPLAPGQWKESFYQAWDTKANRQ
ncbi:MAG: CvpA family protein, partial [Acidobacteriota bacterium]|nr:CvpA family protein [Acidobacteriota bacterium]